MPAPLRIIHCGTGLAGSQALGAILERDEFRLVGLLVHNSSNAGRDAAAFVDQADCGVKATSDFEDIEQLEADVVLYMLIAPNLDHFCRLLASGKNVVTITGLIYPGWRDSAAEQRLLDACRRGRSSFYVTGINPGFVNEVLPLALTQCSRNWSRIQITETANCAGYPSEAMLVDLMGFGQPLADVTSGRAADLSVMADFFLESVAALADGLGLKLDDIAQTRDFVVTSKPLEIAIGRIREGTVAGQRWRWIGSTARVERIVIQTYWVLAFDLGENWPGFMSNDIRWDVEIEGTPSMRLSFETIESTRAGFVPARRYNPATVAAAMNAVHCLDSVARAAPGIVRTQDLPHPRYHRAEPSAMMCATRP